MWRRGEREGQEGWGRCIHIADSLVAQLVRDLPAMWETWVRSLGQEDPLEKGMGYPHQYFWASLVAQLVENPPAMRETWV